MVFSLVLVGQGPVLFDGLPGVHPAEGVALRHLVFVQLLGDGGRGRRQIVEVVLQEDGLAISLLDPVDEAVGLDALRVQDQPRLLPGLPDQGRLPGFALLDAAAGELVVAIPLAVDHGHPAVLDDDGPGRGAGEGPAAIHIIPPVQGEQQPHAALLQGEQPPLYVQAARKARQRPVRAYDPVAGDQDGDGVVVDGLAHGLGGAAARCPGQGPVADRLSKGDLPQRPPHPLLEGGPRRRKGRRGARVPAGEVGVQPGEGGLKEGQGRHGLPRRAEGQARQSGPVGGKGQGPHRAVV